MKKCPTCDKTFDDSMKFCQVDGTPLVDNEPAFDPYATMVGKQAPPAPPAEEPEATFKPEPEETPAPIAEPSNVLEMPEADPLKTMYVSEAEMKEALGQKEEPIIEIPPAPEPPSFSSPEPPAPSFGDMSPPPSPFTTPQPRPEEPVPAPPSFDDGPTMMAPPPFETPSAGPPAEWTPPPVPDAAWQDQQIGSNTPFQPPATGSVNQTLPIVSLILGILSICCYISPLTGIAALITGYLGIKNANNDPQNYGGKGLAIAGMILGGLFLLIGVAYYVIIILMYAGIIAGSVLQGY